MRSGTYFVHLFLAAILSSDYLLMQNNLSSINWTSSQFDLNQMDVFDWVLDADLHESVPFVACWE